MGIAKLAPGAWRRLLKTLGILAAGLILQAAQSPTLVRAQGVEFGDTVVYRNCLKFSAVHYSDRQDFVDNHDWVSLRVRNECRIPLRNLMVELNLMDEQGAVYSGRVWLVTRGQTLYPNMTRMERYAIPDPDQRVAVRWGLRIVSLQGPAKRGRSRAAASPPATAQPKKRFCIFSYCL